MRPQPNQSQQSGEQKKSVFDRLGRQLDPGRQANRRSPSRYGEHPMHPGMHEPPPPEFSGGGRYMRGEGPPEIDWRYDRRQPHMPFGRHDRHPSQVGPPQPPHPMPPYEMDVMGPGREQPPYYQHPHVPQYPPGPPGPMPPMLGGPDPMAMGMHPQRRPSPKYDRHGNPIRGPMRMDHPPGMSPPGNFMGPPMSGPMMPPPPGYDMMPMRPGMYPPDRWDESMGPMGPQMPRLLPNDRFMDPAAVAANQRFQSQQRQQKGPMMMNPELMMGPPQPNFEAPRYSKWRERRDVITNLDRQTAQSSSKTDSLKFSLQFDNRGNVLKRSRGQKLGQAAGKLLLEGVKGPGGRRRRRKKKKKEKPAEIKEPQDISDGEIIDDEDSSDEDEEEEGEEEEGEEEEEDVNDQTGTPGEQAAKNQPENEGPVMANRLKPGYARKPPDGPYHEAGKRRRLHDRDEYSMDYETISDEELDDFMSEKKLGNERDGGEDKNPSEIELLNALGLDWATLVEMSKQSRKETPVIDSALRRFSIPKYLPTLGISRELAGPEIYNLILKITS